MVIFFQLLRKRWNFGNCDTVTLGPVGVACSGMVNTQGYASAYLVSGDLFKLPGGRSFGNGDTITLFPEGWSIVAMVNTHSGAKVYLVSGELFQLPGGGVKHLGMETL